MGFDLEDIRVIQTATVIAGPMASRLLADWGADVIVVEPVKGSMSMDPRYSRGLKEGDRASDMDPGSENINHNKRGITVDLSQACGRDIICRLLETSDVFISNFRPRELEKFRLDYETLSRLNRRLIHANITGYGKRGPDRDLPAFALLAFSRAGVLHTMRVPGVDPVPVPASMPDYITALALAYGIMTALFIRERTGVGQEVDASLFRAGLFSLTGNIAEFCASWQEQPQVLRKDRVNPLRNFYETKDGRWLRIMIMSDRYWSRFCHALGRQDLEHDPRFELFEARTENRLAFFHIVEEAFLSKTLEEWKVRLNDGGLPWAPVQNLAEVVDDPQTRTNDLLIPFEHPTYGYMELVAMPVGLSKTPEKIRTPAPELGQHTEEVLLEHGYTRDDVARFREQHVIA